VDRQQTCRTLPGLFWCRPSPGARIPHSSKCDTPVRSSAIGACQARNAILSEGPLEGLSRRALSKGSLEGLSKGLLAREAAAAGEMPAGMGGWGSADSLEIRQSGQSQSLWGCR
jgi:hypothetical protein